MEYLANKLVKFLEKLLVARVSHDVESRVQPIFVGPPREVMKKIFDKLTANNTREWTIGGEELVVLLIDVNVDSATDGLSQRCNWDYAVSIRNSVTRSIALVTPEALDLRPDSIANTMETIGCQGILNQSDLLSCEPWPFLAGEISSKFNISKDIARYTLNLIVKQTAGLEMHLRESIPWTIVDKLLDPDSNIAPSIGLPFLGNMPLTIENLKASNKVLEDLAKKCAQKGFQATEESLLDAAESIELPEEYRELQIEDSLREMFDNLRGRAGESITFGRCPAWYFRPLTQDASWWYELPFEVLRSLLDETGVRPPPVSLGLRCINALNARGLINDEPVMVYDTVQLQARDANGNIPAQVDFTSRIGRSNLTGLGSTNDGLLSDDPPSHDRPITYKAESRGYRPATMNVISLATFGCQGHARILDAVSNPTPAIQRDGSFEQEITIARSGSHDLQVYRAASASSITINNLGTVNPSRENPAVFTLDIDNGDEINIAIQGSEGTESGKWTVKVLVQESTGDTPRTRFEALVRAHQENRSRPMPVRPIDSFAKRLEDTYLNEPESWRGVIGCWSSASETFTNIEWTNATFGDISVGSDIRPVLNLAQPPQTYLSCRESIQGILSEKRRTIGEIELNDPTLLPIVENYLKEYLDWLTADPQAAIWTDLIAIHAPLINIEAGQETPTSEPVALLISPLHPLRLGWHCNAQHLLEEALDTKKRCPAAGILNTHGCPDILALPIYRDGAVETWRAFLKIGCNEPYWSLLFNKEYLGNKDGKKELLSTLERLGFISSGLISGLTSSHVQRSLNEVHDILSARATLRIGVVGRSQESSSCVSGLINWFQKLFERDKQGKSPRLPNSCEIYDFRDNPHDPSSAMLANLFEETGEKTRWFMKGASVQAEKLDLVLLDQIGTLEPRGIEYTSRTPLASGALFRLNIRRDTGEAQTLQESRIGHQSKNFPGLAGYIVKATLAVETLATNDNVSHLQFQPNQQAVGQRLETASFVMATSSQIDPACFIRGARAHSAYLWDYELPGTLGLEEDRAGYYLMAKPSLSMKDSIIATTRLITDSPPPVESLLDEISRRGIPVLKQMASGGSLSRGELGILLAVRLLQDAFREQNSGIRLPVTDNNVLNILLPVDSYREPLSQFRRVLVPGSSEERPDLLVFSIRVPENNPVQIKITPLEVKFRESNMSNLKIGKALRQAANLGALIDKLWGQTLYNELWTTCSMALLSQCLDQSFRVYADPRVHGVSGDKWVQLHQKVIHDILGLEASITINSQGRSFIFDGSSTTSVVDMDGDGRQDTAILCKSDAEFLLSGIGDISEEGRDAVKLLDFSLPAGEEIQETTTDDTRPPDTSTLPITTQPQPSDETEEIQETNGDETDSMSSELSPTSSQPVISPVPPEVRQEVRAAFDGFIGNENVVERVRYDLLRALIERPPYLSKNYLFTGQPSTGKTELARRMAIALSLPFIHLDGRSIVSRERLFQLIQGELTQQGLNVEQVGNRAGLPVLRYPPLIVFIDEVHLVPRGVQESMLTVLEAEDRTAPLPNHFAIMRQATFLFATTRASVVDDAFRSRCAEVQLREYALDEVAEMIARKFPDVWPREVYMRIAKLGRCVPRIAIELAKELETVITVSEHPERTPLEHLEEVRTLREIDAKGLTHLDIQYLTAIEQENRPVGEQAIINMIGTVDRDRMVSEVEPFLRRLGFLRLGPRGREITQEGKEYLLDMRRRSGQS